MKFFAVLAAVAVLAGCSPYPSYSSVKQTKLILTVEEGTDFITKPPEGVAIYGESVIGDGFCRIKLAKYPRCLLHEIRHCLEGEWHSNKRPNKRDC